MVSNEEFARATARSARRQATTPRAIAARYDDQSARVIVTMSNGIDIAFSPNASQGLESATAEQLSSIEISPSGFGLHFPALDADLYLPSVLEGILGSARWMAAQMGTRGGRSRSEAKVAASRENGKLGGRPSKKARPRAQTRTKANAKLRGKKAAAKKVSGTKDAGHLASRGRRRKIRRQQEPSLTRRAKRARG